MTSRKRKKRKQQNITAMVLFGMTLLFFVGFGYAIIDQSKYTTPDENFCYEDQLNSMTVVFFDASFSMTKRRQRDINKIFKNLFKNELGFNEKVILLTTERGQVSSVPDERLILCRPAMKASELDSVNADSNVTKEFLKSATAKLYEKQVMPVVNDLMSLKYSQGSESPILDYIRSISYRRDFSDNSLHSRKLIIISDLIQNRAPIHFCEKKDHLPVYSVFKQRAYFDGIKAKSLNGVKVVIYMAKFDSYNQFLYCTEAELRRFYTDYFKDIGASEVVIHQLLL